MLRATPVLAVVLIWALVISWRPSVLGFYHDDWWSLALPLEVSSLGSVLSKDPARATHVFLVWVGRQLFGANPIPWQILAALVHLGCALLIYGILERLERKGDHPGISRWAGAAASAFWLCAPWSLAYSAWPIMSLPLLCVAGLAASGCILLSRDSSPTVGWLAASFYIAGSAIYEAAWGGFVPMAALAAFTRWRAGEPLRPIYTYATVSACGQMILLVLNRLLSQPGTGKTISNSSLDVVSVTFRIAELEIKEAISSSSGVIVFASIITIVILMIVISNWKGRVDTLIYVLISFAGILGCVVLHSLAGYGIEWRDLQARTAMVPSFWLAIAFGVTLRPALLNGLTIRAGCSFASLVLLLVFSWELLAKTTAWAGGWRQQQALLGSFPVHRAGEINPYTVILADLPRSREARANFDAFWDISGALAATYPEHSHLFVRDHKSQVTVLRPDFWTEWDGMKVSQGWCRAGSTVLWSLPAQSAIRWRQDLAVFESVPQGIRIGCHDLAPDGR
jgi:hypothetical protein